MPLSSPSVIKSTIAGVPVRVADVATVAPGVKPVYTIVTANGKPAILLADEPTGNLDSRNGEAVMDLLKELHAGGATICMVTHDAHFAEHADRTVHLFDGRVVEEAIAA